MLNQKDAEVSINSKESPWSILDWNNKGRPHIGSQRSQALCAIQYGSHARRLHIEEVLFIFKAEYGETIM